MLTVAYISKLDINMIASKYSIPSTKLCVHETKRRMWQHFVDTLNDSGIVIFLYALVVFLIAFSVYIYIFFCGVLFDLHLSCMMLLCCL